MSAMLPYSFAFGVVWIILFLAWFGLGLPFGPGAPTTWAPVAP
jgi:aminobenzoyl-glutamate transport protein